MRVHSDKRKGFPVALAVKIHYSYSGQGNDLYIMDSTTQVIQALTGSTIKRIF